MTLRMLLVVLLSCNWGAAAFSQDLHEERISIFFAHNEAELTDEARTELSKLPALLRETEVRELNIFAHTDGDGTDQYNLDLSKRRGTAVRDFLVAIGIPDDQLVLAALGESRPARDNDEEAGRAFNRRVDVVVRYAHWLTLRDWQKSLAKPYEQRFVISPEDDVLLNGQHGTQIWIDRADFAFADGRLPTEPIEINLTEAYDFTAMVATNLHTTSGGQLLQTGGMVQLTAQSGGQPLQLAPGRDLVVAVPTETFQTDMEIFYGSEKENELTDWQPTGQLVRNERIAQLELPQRPKRLVSKRMPLPTMPKYSIPEPMPPVRPRKPLLFVPDPNKDVRAHANWWERNFRKGKVEATQQRLAEKHQKKYERARERKAEYDRQYAEQLAQFVQDSSTFEARHAQWVKDREAFRTQFLQSEECQAIRKFNEELIAKDNAINQKRYEKWQEKRNAALAAYAKHYDQKGVTNAQIVNQYFMNVNQLGWINVDRFMKQQQTEILAVRDEQPTNEAKVFLIFPELRSMLPAQRDSNGQYRFQNLPDNTVVQVVGLKVQNGKALLAKHELVTGRVQDVQLEYQPTSFSALQALLQS